MQVDGICPYCGEAIQVEVEEGLPGTQHVIEDCWVCCRPIEVIASMGEDGMDVQLRREDE